MNPACNDSGLHLAPGVPLHPCRVHFGLNGSIKHCQVLQYKRAHALSNLVKRSVRQATAPTAYQQMKLTSFVRPIWQHNIALFEAYFFISCLLTASGQKRG